MPRKARDVQAGLGVQGCQVVWYRYSGDDEQVCGMEIERGCEPPEQRRARYRSVDYRLELGFGDVGRLGQVTDVQLPVFQQPRRQHVEARMFRHVVSVASPADAGSAQWCAPSEGAVA